MFVKFVTFYQDQTTVSAVCVCVYTLSETKYYM